MGLFKRPEYSTTKAKAAAAPTIERAGVTVHYHRCLLNLKNSATSHVRANSVAAAFKSPTAAVSRERRCSELKAERKMHFPVILLLVCSYGLSQAAPAPVGKNSALFDFKFAKEKKTRKQTI